MINFYPVWITPAGALPGVTENETVTIALQAAQIATFMGEQGQTSVFCGNSAAYVSDVKINTVDTSAYEVVGQYVIFANALSTNDIVELTTSAPLTYSMLYNNLPPGLIVGTTGLITGKVGLLPSDGPSLTYTFAIRVNDGTTSRDRQFTMVATPSSVEIAPPGWGDLPVLQVQQATPSAFAYVPLGQTTRGVPFQFQLSLFLPNGRAPELVLEDFLDATSIQPPFDAFPAGLSLNTSTGLITGAVSTSTPIGKYFFKIMMLDGRGNAITVGTGAYPITCCVEVVGLSQPLSALNFIVWTTTAGSLATIYEGQAFPVGVFATSTTGAPVTYTLSPSTPLPSGLTLNSSTGYIEGVVGHVGQDTTYTFSIRASSGQAFSDQTFSITVLNRYTTPDFLNISFNLRVRDTTPLASYYTSVISSGSYFRPTDVNFASIVSSGAIKILLVGGLKGDLVALEATIRNSGFDAPISLLLGEHKIAYAKLNGVTVYEVLYRDVIDPLAGAGGYTVLNGVPTAAPMLYPESNPATPIDFYPPSLANLRDEFVADIGFPTLDPTLTHNLLLANGAENLPLWMTSPQTGTDASTALGYIPAVALAYLIPGTGQAALNAINVRVADPDRPTDAPDPVTVGHEIDFDQYYVDFQTLADQTTFDSQATTFDGGITLFDGFAYSGGKFFRINRAQFNLTSS